MAKNLQMIQAATISKIQKLSKSELELLGVAILELASLDDLSRWLRENVIGQN